MVIAWQGNLHTFEFIDACIEPGEIWQYEPSRSSDWIALAKTGDAMFCKVIDRIVV
jgi:hypothetical protein